MFFETALIDSTELAEIVAAMTLYRKSKVKKQFPEEVDLEELAYRLAIFYNCASGCLIEMKIKWRNAQ